MRWSTCVKGAGLVLAGLAGVVPAQNPVPGVPVHPQYTPYVAPSVPYYQGYGYPGCPVPGMPYGTMPPGMLPPGISMPTPSTPSTPGTTPPSTPSTNRPSTDPSTSGVTNADGRGGDQTALQQAAAAAAQTDGRSAEGSGGGGERGSGGVASLAPNMFGDIFGGGRIRSTVPADRLALIRTFVNNPVLTENVPIGGGRIQGRSTGGFQVYSGARTVSNFIPYSQAFYAAIAGGAVSPSGGAAFFSPPGSGGGIGGPGQLPNPAQFGLTFVTQFNNGAEYTSASSFNTSLNRVNAINSPSNSRLNQLTSIFAGRNGGREGQVAFVPSASGAYLSQDQSNPFLRTIEAAIIADYLVTSDVASPSAGGIVGRTKISDDNSPYPRDRIIFNYDYYSATPLGFDGADVHRFSPGFEITFFDQWMSAEIRMPFSGTLSSNLIADAYTPRETVFGNITTALKWLMFRSGLVNITSGCSFAFPTAPDQFIRLSNGTPLVKFSNDSVVCTPFAALFLTPTDRFVFQTWWAVALDTLGSRVSANTNLTGLERIGTYREPALSQISGQMSYWFYQSNGAWSWLTGLAGFVEMHHNTNMSRPNPLTIGNFNFSDGTKYNDLNLTAGLIFNISDAATFQVGIASPLRNEPDRGFDYQIGIRGSIFFGPTLRDRTGALFSTF